MQLNNDFSYTIYLNGEYRNNHQVVTLLLMDCEVLLGIPFQRRVAKDEAHLKITKKNTPHIEYRYNNFNASLRHTKEKADTNEAQSNKSGAVTTNIRAYKPEAFHSLFNASLSFYYKKNCVRRD